MKLPDLTLAADVNAAIARLDQAGWVEIGRGDWSWVYAAPAGDVAVRLSPWDPAYALHVRLCIDNPGNPYLQRIDRIDPLGRVGSAVWMQRLQAADEERAMAFCHALGFGSASNPEWLQRTPATPWPEDDASLRELRVLLATAMASGERTLPLWGGSDVSPKNILADHSGQLKLIDPFFVRGRDIVAALQRHDATALVGYRPDELRAFLQIPVFTPGPALAALQQAVDDLFTRTAADDAGVRHRHPP